MKAISGFVITVDATFVYSQTEMNTFRADIKSVCSLMSSRLILVLILYYTCLTSTTLASDDQDLANCRRDFKNTPKIDCHPEPNANETECKRRKCCWQNKLNTQQAPFVGEPSCFFSSDFNCYKLLSQDKESNYEENVLRWSLIRKQECASFGFPDDVSQIEVEVGVYGDSLINIKISPLNEPNKLKPHLPEINLPSKRRSNVHNSKFFSFNETTKGRIVLNKLFVAELAEEQYIRVIHLVSGKTLFEADLGKLIYSKRFIQLPTYLDSPFIYGLGQHMGESLLKSSENYASSYTMFNYGHPVKSDGRTSYSSYPFYINLLQLHERSEPLNRQTILDNFEKERKLMAIGALMLNSNAMDVLVHSNKNDDKNSRAGITWRLVGGSVNLFLFMGPKPNDVLYQLQSLVGKPMLPPVWALGYHQSRHNYGSLMEIKTAWIGTRLLGIPLEAIWTDIEFLWRGTSYTLNDPELNDLVKILQQEYGMHYVPIVDPTLSLKENPEDYCALELAQNMNLFATYTDEKGEKSVATVTSWAESKQCGVLDYTNNNSVSYLQTVLTDYKNQLSFDGLWLDMNEPEVFSNEPIIENAEPCALDEKLIYQPANRNLNDRTLCMSAEFAAGKHFDIHNLYAFYQSKAHFEALKLLNPEKRPFLISRSQFIGQSKYSGTWLGDIGSSFEHMRWSILGSIESNLFGQPFVGADICGFFDSTNDELCARWFSLGAFYPFARNHNDANSKNQDPASLGEEVQLAARLAMMKRYSLLPYLYTLFYSNHINAEPVMRSILFEHFDKFYLREDLDKLPQIDDQFMLGPALMVAPVVHVQATSRDVYLSPGRWYDVSIGLPGTNMAEENFDVLTSNWRLPTNDTHFKLDEQSRNRLEFLRRPIDCTVDSGCWLKDQFTPIGSINLYLRGGHIVPVFRSIDHTNSIGRKWENTSLFLEIAPDVNQEAYGEAFWDNGDSNSGSFSKASISYSERRLKVILVEDGSKDDAPMKLDGFLVYGVETFQPTEYMSTYKDVRLLYSYESRTQTLSCTFVSKTGEIRNKPITLERYNSLTIRW